MPTIKLAAIECTRLGEAGKRGDDLYIKYTVDGASREVRFPDSYVAGRMDIKKGESWTLGLSISYEKTLRIDLYDEDRTSSNDYLGGHEYSAADASKTSTFDTNSSQDGQYLFHTVPGA